MKLAERLAEDRRGVVLRMLLAAEGDGLNEDLLTREVSRLRIGTVTRDDMRGLLAWLERQLLVEIEKLEGDELPEGELWVAKATRAGRDVARGAAHPGVAKPL